MMNEGKIKKKKEEGKVGGNIFIAIFAASKNKKRTRDMTQQHFIARNWWWRPLDFVVNDEVW